MRASHEANMKRRSNAVDFALKNHLIRKKSKYEIEKGKLMNVEYKHAIVDSLNGRKEMIDRQKQLSESRSRSVV